MTDHFKDLISTMQAALAEAEAQRERLDTIAATIRINALRHGATDEQVAAFLTGEADFVGWLKAQISSPQAVRPGAPVTLTYTNWRGDTEVRRIIPRCIWWGSTAWHPEPQWILTALDVDKDKERHFALKDFGQPITVRDELLARAEAAEVEVALLRQALSAERALADAFAAGLRIGDHGGVIVRPGYLRAPIAHHAAMRAITEGRE